MHETFHACLARQERSLYRQQIVAIWIEARLISPGMTEDNRRWSLIPERFQNFRCRSGNRAVNASLNRFEIASSHRRPISPRRSARLEPAEAAPGFENPFVFQKTSRRSS